MATVTPNFLWPVPQSTDLVKDGATAIEALGDSIDASLVDLKGGTTGQVLSKTSNTDMDFTWVAADDTNAIQNTIVDAKGDLIAASAADTPARLAVGNNGETLVADSSTSTGLRYQGHIEAGKNFIINGGMDIWQRGTSFTNPGSTYTVDRWTGYWSANGTVTQETSNVPAGCRYALKMTATANSGGNNFYQLIETNNTIPLAGKTVTFSIYVAGTAGKTPTIGIDTSTVVDDSLFGSWSALVSSSSVTTSTTYQRVSVTGTIPSNTKSIRVNINSASVNNTDYILWSGAQLEIGSVPTTFSRAGGTIQGELAACQRYYWRNQATTGFVVGDYYTTTRFFAVYKLPTTMRINPTFAASGTTIATIYYNGASRTSTNILVSDSSQDFGSVEFVTAAATAGNAGRVVCSTGGSYLEWSAEL